MATLSNSAQLTAILGLTANGLRSTFISGVQTDNNLHTNQLGSALVTRFIKNRNIFVPTIILKRVIEDFQRLKNKGEELNDVTYLFPLMPSKRKVYKSSNEILKYSFGIGWEDRLIKLISSKGTEETYIGGPGFIADEKEKNPIIICGYDCMVTNGVFHVISPKILIDSSVPGSSDKFKKYVYNYLMPYFAPLPIHPYHISRIIGDRHPYVYLFRESTSIDIQICDLTDKVYKVPEARTIDFEKGIYDFLANSYNDGKVLWGVDDFGEDED